MTADVDALDRARRQLGLSHYELWMRYLGLCGTSSAHATYRYLGGRNTLTDIDHDHLVVALNEAFLDAGSPHRLPYRRA